MKALGQDVKGKNMDAGVLNAAIAAVCPVNSVKVGKNDDRATWSFDAAAGATPAQITAANNVITTIGIAVLSVVKFDAFIARWTDPEYALLMQRRAQAITAGNVTLVKQWDIAAIQGQVDLNSPAAQTFKAAIVSAGILSQARADAIFS